MFRSAFLFKRLHSARAIWMLPAATVLLLTGCASQPGAESSAATPKATTGVTDAMLTGPQDGMNWLSYNFNPQEQRYSPLDLINEGNVDQLGLAWNYELSFAQDGGQEATPLVYDGTLYSITNWSIVYALDARTGEELWRWDPEVNKEKVRPKICCGIVNRGVALYGDLVIAPSIDGRLFGLDRKTGQPVWESRVAYSQDDYTITTAPRIANGKVIIGVGGAEFPVRGFFDAYDALTGKRAWRFYTVPGDPAEGFENEAMERASKTWGPDSWKLGGGGTTWDSTAYDPDQNIVIVGTGNAGPWPDELRGSEGLDALYAASIVAVDADTGDFRWYFQMVPGDTWDYDSVAQVMLADLEIDGAQRKVAMQANKDGFFYVVDRTNGEFISGAPFSKVTWASGLDPETGRPIVNEDAQYSQTRTARVMPGPGGAHNWPPMSFNPATGLVYIPGQSGGRPFSYTADAAFEYDEGGLNLGIVVGAVPSEVESPEVAAARARGENPASKMVEVVRNPEPPFIGPDVEGGTMVAWNPATQTEVWRVMEGGSLFGGTLSTGGNLVFQTTPAGKLIAWKADDGTKLYEVDLGVRNMGPPMTFELDGEQFVALTGGIGRGRNQGFGTDNRSADAPDPQLWVFKLGGKPVQ